ncbi:hypothetical protein NQ176_g648 [Zarea fungicola]|uniref:Uncharacterized protein n=1 Tax=Zarea fungicola TaxID=93591 RepID=A0ACC1NVX9_9HYPO|nr:hypothetical protein NQ176_g648 [Lecanicillium fungicola]
MRSVNKDDSNQLGEFCQLTPATKLYIEQVYAKLLQLWPGGRTVDSYERILRALSCIGVGPFEYNPKACTTPESLVAEWVHQLVKTTSSFEFYGDNDYDEEFLLRRAKHHDWSLDELKIIAMKWMNGKDQNRLLEPGRLLLTIYQANHRKSKAVKSKVEGSISDIQTADQPKPSTLTTPRSTTQSTTPSAPQPVDFAKSATSRSGYSRTASLREQGRTPGHTFGNYSRYSGRKEADGVLPDESPHRNGAGLKDDHTKAYIDDETLRLIKRVKEAHEAVGQRTAKLVAHLLGPAQNNESRRLPPHRRIEANQPIDYPWRNKESRSNQKRNGRRS